MTKLVFTLYFLCISLLLLAQDYQLTWQNCFGGSEQDKTRDIIEVEEGYFIVGFTDSDDGDISLNHGYGDGWIIFVDSVGNLIWEKTYGGSNGDSFRKIIPSDNNTFILVGGSGSSDGDISYDPYPGSADFWIVKIDLEGNIIWDRIVGGNWGETIWSGFGTSDGGVVAYGWTDSDDGDVSQYYGLSDAWMIKLSSDGEIEWDYTIGTDWVDVGQAAMQTSDGGYLMACNANMLGNNTGNITCTPHSLGWNEAVLFKLDANLNLEWQHCYGGSEHDGITALMEVSDGYVFGAYTGSNDGDVTGWHVGYNHLGDPEPDAWIVKIDFDGNIVWQNALGGSNGESSAKNIIELNNQDLMLFINTYSNDGDVSGNHSMSEYDSDIWMVKLNSTGEIFSQQCFGGAGKDRVEYGVVKKSDNNYVIAGQTDYGPSYDVACTPHGGNNDEDFWVFEIKDCSQYPVGSLQTPTGVDTTCTVYDSTNIYTISPASGAWYYEWQLMPVEAGTINGNDLQATTTWTTGWEGQASIQARAMNDCDTSEWSEPYYTEVFTCLGLEELYAGNIKLKVYPNPAGEYVVFELPANTHKAGAAGTQGDSLLRFGMTGVDGANVVIVDVFGREVATKQIISGKTVFDLRQFQQGIYFYRLEIDGYDYSGKFVVQR